MNTFDSLKTPSESSKSERQSEREKKSKSNYQGFRRFDQYLLRTFFLIHTFNSSYHLILISAFARTFSWLRQREDVRIERTGTHVTWSISRWTHFARLTRLISSLDASEQRHSQRDTMTHHHDKTEVRWVALSVWRDLSHEINLTSTISN